MDPKFVRRELVHYTVKNYELFNVKTDLDEKTRRFARTNIQTNSYPPYL